MNTLTYPELQKYPVPSRECDFILDSLEMGMTAREAFAQLEAKQEKKQNYVAADLADEYFDEEIL